MQVLRTIKISLASSLVLMAVAAVVPTRTGHSQPTDTAKPAPATPVPAQVPAPTPPPAIQAIQERVAEKAAQLKEENAKRVTDAEAVKRGVETLNSSLDDLANATARAKAAADSIAAAAAADAKPTPGTGGGADPDSLKDKPQPQPRRWWQLFGR